MALLSPASLTLKFDAILDCPEGDEALSDSALPLLFRPLSPRPISALSPPGLPRSYSTYEPAPPVAPVIVEEIVVASPSSTLVGSPGHTAIAESPRSYVSSSGSTRSRSASGHRHYGSGSSTQYVYAQPARSVRSSGSVATARERPRYERAKSSGVKMTVIPATPRRVSRGSVVSYKSETDEHGKIKLSTKLRRLFGLGPKREEIKASERSRAYVYPSGSSTHRRSTSRGSTTRVVYT
ncbi:hypothetical protein RhiJN_04359 [Ceratobasidium sp. AG-Ba]|nr:hypothetical protein RhiJN_04359 [Ceratobasidium sp. AG-Ba]QRW05248.1 hypothetical protein RhiLY_04247 [Ceratobasidium sp. AG-Ba]